MEASGQRAPRWVVVAAAVSLLVSLSGAHAAESDLWVEVVGPGWVAAGQPATYTVRYGNDGPDPAASAFLAVALPREVPKPFDELTQDDVDAIQASAAGSDTLGNEPRVVRNRSCDGLLVELRGPGVDPGAPLQVLQPGAVGEFSVTVAFPMVPVPRVELRVLAPPRLATAISRLGEGTWLDCSDPHTAQFGVPLSQVLVEGEAILADDGSTDPTFGCSPLGAENAGRMVVFERGGCEFGMKTVNAQLAGAVGAVIVNDGRCGDAPPSADCVVDMFQGDLPAPPLLPTVMVSRADGAPLLAALRADEDVRLSFGGFPTRRPGLEARVSLGTPDDVDRSPGNDRAELRVMVEPLASAGPVRRGRGGRIGG
jgi:hypothetical protein